MTVTIANLTTKQPNVRNKKANQIEQNTRVPRRDIFEKRHFRVFAVDINQSTTLAFAYFSSTNTEFSAVQPPLSLPDYTQKHDTMNGVNFSQKT